ncbi:uncharacterized protein LOC107198367 [Parus major]|uniref:uncharacterized protein LOC107198367 n=1 Tax=Parus major TaxID=9157 RepID=UPI001443F620|nr:uncharacterized protein LOC107198367 [Parus major]
MSCPDGYWPSPMELKCVILKPREGSVVPRSGWIVRNGTDTWHHMEENLTCVEVLQVDPESLKISSTSIKLNWTCMHPDMCQHIRARCRLEHHPSSNCEAKEVKGEEILQGQEGTFTCSPLQPFTVYSVTISLLPRTILYTRFLTTKETVPDKPENLLMDVSTGTLRWKALPSCKGEIIGYQVPGIHVGCPWSLSPCLELCAGSLRRDLNITTMRAEDGGFLGFSQVLVNQSVSEYVPPNQRAGRKYLVTVQGLTAAGAGAAAELEFKTYIQGWLGRLPDPPAGAMAQGSVPQSLPLPCPSRCAGRGTLSCCLSLQQGLDTHFHRGADTQQQGWGHCWCTAQPVTPTPLCVFFEGPWPVSAVIVVVVVVLLIPLSAGILWFLLSRRKKALPSKAEEDHYTELQPYENVHEGNYCVMETFLEKDAGKCGQAGEPSPKPLPVLESSGQSEQ